MNERDWTTPCQHLAPVQQRLCDELEAPLEVPVQRLLGTIGDVDETIREIVRMLGRETAGDGEDVRHPEAT